MCVCIELLRNTASPQLIRQKKNTFASKEFGLNSVGMQLRTPFVIDVVLLSHSVFFLFLLSLVFVSLSLVYICLISRVLLFMERNEKKQSRGARRETEGGGTQWEKIEPTRARFKSAQTVEKPQKNLKSDIIS